MAFSKTDEHRIALFGMTGAGKSSLANILTNSKAFRVSGTSRSETKTVQSATTIRNGHSVKVVDTPGFFDTDMTFSDLQERIIPFLGETSPGPHAIIYVIHAGRHTPQDVEGVKAYLDMFGEGILPFSMIAFTKLAANMTKREYMHDLQSDLMSFVEKCGSRYVFLPEENQKEEMESKIIDFFKIIDDMMKNNRNESYTEQMFKTQQKLLETKLEEQRQQQIKEKEEELAKNRAEAETDFNGKVMALEREVNISNEEKKEKEREIQKIKQQIEANDVAMKQLQETITLPSQNICNLQRKQKTKRKGFLKIGNWSPF